MARLLITVTALAALLSIAACDEIPGVSTSTTITKKSAPLTADGPAAPLAAVDSPDGAIQRAAAVVRVDPLPDQNAKLFGVGGGDPAMNGLDAHIAFFRSPAEGWAVYRIGDILDYTVLSTAPGRVDLDLRESTMDSATGQIGDRHRKVIVQWTVGADGAAPAAVTVTPAA
ncbi:hypothetical protein [Brevundimonas sp. R86498]|uniref:hypothetical protein n=1 Tax=Brevundimonas sp. R86498 TaxID=3093845 RepID=UPI0037CB9E55